MTIAGSDVSGKADTKLSAEGGVNIIAVDENHLERSKNKSTGFNAGVAISYGSSGLAFGVTAGGNVAKGYGNGESQAWVGSYVGSKESKTKIESGTTTNIIGSQVVGKRVEVNARDLNIESVQDTMKYQGKQESVSGQVTVGYGVSGSASYSNSKVKADYASVNQQAGIFAGDKGYDVNVANHTDLKGGTITSTENAEKSAHNKFSTGTLTHQDIQNQSSYSANGFGLNGGFSVSGGEAPKEIGSMKLQQISQNHQDGSSKVELGGVAGVASQGNWGIAKGVATAFLGQVSDKGNESGVTTSSINTANIQIRDTKTQQPLTGRTEEETAKAINKVNIHQTVSKADVKQMRADLDRDLTIATDFVKNLGERGDQIYYRMEKNEDSVFSIQDEVKNKNCNHISCLGLNGEDFKDNSQELKAIIYGDQILTDEQAKLLSNVATAGMLNLDKEDKVSSAILYGKTQSSLDETPVILNRGSAGTVNEFLFTGFERFRAWANMPVILGASNATRDHAQINKKLEEYNAYRVTQGKQTISANNVAHSLGVSGNKNMLNWSEYVGNKYDNTEINFSHLGGSYSSAEIDSQAKGLFKKTNTQYHGVDGDYVYSGLKGLFIGNNPNAKQVKGLSFTQAHTYANYNIDNLKYVETIDRIKIRSDFLKNIYPNSGVRKFNEVQNK